MTLTNTNRFRVDPSCLNLRRRKLSGLIGLGLSIYPLLRLTVTPPQRWARLDRNKLYGAGQQGRSQGGPGVHFFPQGPRFAVQSQLTIEKKLRVSY
jgi:hypothetical protein